MSFCQWFSIFLIGVCAWLALFLMLDDNKIYKLNKQISSYEAAIKLQNDSILKLKDNSDQLNSKLNEVEKINQEQSKEQQKRSEVILRIPEIEDCKEVIKWGVINTKKVIIAW